MKKIILSSIILMLSLMTAKLFAECGKSRILIMPEELIEVAEKNGYTQVDEFYCNKPGLLKPCYAYGYVYSENEVDDEKSAVFWARKIGADGNTLFLIFVSRSAGYLQFSLDDVIEVKGYPGGVSIVRDTSVTLDNFYFLKDLKKGPENVKLEGNIIRDSYDGVATDYYNYKGEWLIREWD